MVEDIQLGADGGAPRPDPQNNPLGEKNNMLAGRLYLPCDETLAQDHARTLDITYDFNATRPSEEASRVALLHKLLGSCGEEVHIEPPFRCDYGYNIFVGDRFFANYGCVILDTAPVTIGKNVLFGPNVSLFAAFHPVDARVRATGLECSAPIHISDDVWIGGGAIINPGVTIGARTIIGSGSVVTKDIPADVIAVGNPCRPLRSVGEKDRAYWQARQDARFDENDA
ncbi:MAG: sugar O-acetyltransferase [Atopobiaceae bacterium]